MAASSAGILLYRLGDGGAEVLLVHPGGPYWARKDSGAWSIPKGELDADEEPRAAALREFAEETGTQLPDGALDELGSVKLKSGKLVTAFAVAGDLDPATLRQQHVRARVAAAQRAACRRSRRSTARSGSASTPRARSSTPRRPRSSTAWRRCSRADRCPGWESNPHALSDSRT